MCKFPSHRYTGIYIRNVRRPMRTTIDRSQCDNSLVVWDMHPAGDPAINSQDTFRIDSLAFSGIGVQ